MYVPSISNISTNSVRVPAFTLQVHIRGRETQMQPVPDYGLELFLQRDLPLARDARNPAAHYYLGESLLKSGDSQAAGDHFKHAVAGGGADFPNAHRHLGFLYKEKRLTALACNAFSEYIRFAPAAAYDREEIARLVKGMCN